ncbi:MAG: hypothetical protein HYT79_12190 [Elusimicrobia bacterium]|nr:hypothetical protein [Elusimicrobiota bacterium]
MRFCLALGVAGLLINQVMAQDSTDQEYVNAQKTFDQGPPGAGAGSPVPLSGGSSKIENNNDSALNNDQPGSSANVPVAGAVSAEAEEAYSPNWTLLNLTIGSVLAAGILMAIFPTHGFVALVGMGVATAFFIAFLISDVT